MTAGDTEIPILPRRPGILPSSHEILSTPYVAWHPQRPQYQGLYMEPSIARHVGL